MANIAGIKTIGYINLATPSKVYKTTAARKAAITRKANKERMQVDKALNELCVGIEILVAYRAWKLERDLFKLAVKYSV